MICPHGDLTCPCPDGDACHYEGADAMRCRPDLAPSRAHCHVEGCSWWVHLTGETEGECGLLKLGFPPAHTTDDGERFYSMSQAKPGQPGSACGWLRSPLNVGARAE